MFEQLSQLARDARQITEYLTEETGMTFSSVQVLSEIQAAGGALSVGEIAQRTGIAKPNMTPLIDRLEKTGYVRREHAREDRRTIIITLEETAYEMLLSVEDKVKSLEDVGMLLDAAAVIHDYANILS